MAKIAEVIATIGNTSLVTVPVFYPNQSIDGSQPADGEGIVDTGIEINDVRLYIGRRLGRTVGTLFGMVDSMDLDQERARNAAQARTIQALEAELAELQPIADSIARFSQREGIEA